MAPLFGQSSNGVRGTRSIAPMPTPSGMHLQCPTRTRSEHRPPGKRCCSRRANQELKQFSARG
eukprot:11725692-Prorocentrum_lima.AAC.1